jgi:hypothetical protein
LADLPNLPDLPLLPNLPDLPLLPNLPDLPLLPFLVLGTRIAISPCVLTLGVSVGPSIKISMLEDLTSLQ